MLETRINPMFKILKLIIGNKNLNYCKQDGVTN